MAGYQEQLPSESDWGELLSLSTRLHDASNRHMVMASLGDFEALLLRKPALRTEEVKRFVVEQGVNKRAIDTAMWDVEVAVCFRRVLTVFDLPPSELQRNPSYSAPSAAREPTVHGAVAVVVPSSESDVAGLLESSGSEDPFLGPESFAIPSRRHRMLMYNLVVSLCFSVVLVVSFFAGRDFGIFYFSNILLFLLSVVGVIINLRVLTVNKRLYAVMEWFTFALFSALWVGSLLSVYFILSVGQRMQRYCDGDTNCTHAGVGAYKAGAAIGACCLACSYFILFWWATRDANDLLQAVKLFVEQDGVRTKQTSVSAVVEVCSIWMLPGPACCRLCNARCCRPLGNAGTVCCSTCGAAVSACADCGRACRGGGCRTDVFADDKACAMCCCCSLFGTFIISAILCAATKSSFMCALAEFTGDMLTHLN